MSEFKLWFLRVEFLVSILTYGNIDRVVIFSLADQRPTPATPYNLNHHIAELSLP